MANPVGKPLAFKSVEELQQKIEKYFEWCNSRTKKIVTKDGNVIEESWPRPHTISGLADWLDVDRSTIVNYGKKEEYFNTIARARRKCEAWTEEQLFEGNDRGAKFVLINNYAGWKDKNETEITGKDGGAVEINVNIIDE